MPHCGLIHTSGDHNLIKLLLDFTLSENVSTQVSVFPDKFLINSLYLFVFENVPPPL